MRNLVFSASLTLLAASANIGNRPAAALPFGPETCKQGFVWREACGPDDHVCVVPATRTQAAEDNAARSSRVQPGGGSFGIDTCKQGFVWREACGPQDHVCVPPAIRTQAVQDNAVAAGRFEETPILWDVLTQHNDPARNGLQPHETILTPATVTPSGFGRLYERAVNGQIIAQPLYVSNQWFHDKGLRNVVYVATRKNWIYAFDADNTNPDPNAGLIWAHPVQTEPDGPVPGMCLETRGSVGITATPVIDRASDTMYVVSRKSDGTIWLSALDIGTGVPKAGTPGVVPITAQVTINGQTISFDHGLELSRAALLLQNGAVFFGFSALNCDNPGKIWHGWLLAYRAPDLVQVGAFVTAENNAHTGGGIWQSGNGIVGDGENIYFETGNGGGPVPAGGPLDESFIKLHVGAPPSYGLTLAGRPYTVSNRDALNGGDTDLGSGGPVLLPGNRLVGGGKQGKLYVLDTATMKPAQFPRAGPLVPGGNDGLQAFVNSWHDDPNQPVCDDESMLRRQCYMPHPRYENSELTGPNIHTGPVYWDSAQPNAGRLYAMPEKDFLRTYAFDHGSHTLGATAAAVSPLRSPDGMPGAFLSISANGGSNGIIWASVPDHDGQWENGFGYLVAIDAITLKELWRDPDAIAFAKFNPPTVAGGKVFRPTFADKLIVYGPTAHPPAIPCYNIAQKFQNLAAAEGYLGAATNAGSVAPDGVGHFQHFGGDKWEGFEGASIYWTPTTCAHEVHGAIRNFWSSIGWERSVLGYPVTDQLMTPDGIGAYNHFQSGSIYSTPLTGAHEVHGVIRGQWSAMGWELSPLGYPVSDETDEIDGSGRFNVFEHGTIHWRRSDGAITVQLANGMLVGPGQGEWDRPGGDIENFPLPQPDPSMCQQRCADNGACQAWTYGNPGLAGPQAHCWLKNSTPEAKPNGCCTSGLRAVLAPANMNKPDGAVDRPGGDFYGFDLPDADHRLCEAECSLNGQCKSWAYVRPTVQGPAARCYMKNSATIATNGNGCCVSGTKK